jgi:hypothetical protein
MITNSIVNCFYDVLELIYYQKCKQAREKLVKTAMKRYIYICYAEKTDEFAEISIDT